MGTQILKENPDVIETLVKDKEGLFEMKFLTAKLPYEKEDMENCVQKICENGGLTYDQLFDISDNKQELILGFKEAVRRLKDGELPNFFCIHGHSDNHWLIFSFARIRENDDDDVDTFFVFYKNPNGGFMPEEIAKKINEIFKQPVRVVLNCKNDIDRDNDNYYGPLTIRNLLKMLDMDWKNKDIIEQFKTFSFATSEDVCKEKIKIATEMAKELGNNGGFIKDLRNFVGKIPVKCKKDVEEYEKLVVDLAGDDKKSQEISLDQVRKLRDKLLADKEIQQLQSEHEKMCVRDDKKEIKEFKHDIQRQYELEMMKLTVMFGIVDGCKLHYNNLKEYLKPILTSLKMTEKELESLYEVEKALKKQQDKEKETSGGDTNSKQQEWHKGAKKGGTVTPLKDILKKVAIGIDRSPTNETIASQEDQDKLESIVNRVQKETIECENKSAEDVTTWAKTKKGCLGKDENEVIKALGVMNRALALASAKNMRHTQLVAIAIVLLLRKNDNAGTLCQVKTGEGKTIIVSILAAIRCLQGYTVDVITSNAVLAQEGVDESKGFFQLLNIDAKVTNVPNSYISDVLYGTVSNFQFDYLRDLTEGTTLRKNRKFQQVILDEVDSMLVDNGGNIAKLSSSFPGMECLRYIYIKIWKELYKARESYAKETKSVIAKFEKDNAKVNATDFHKNYKIKLDGILEAEKPTIQGKLNKIDSLIDYPLIPKHLREYCNSKKETWITNAIHALYECHENEHYRVCNRDENDITSECFIAPVDFSNTGVTLTNTVWSNGLHQFVQLKHNVELTFESLTSSFISNMGYIKLYPKNLIFGLSGTLGSTNEQNLLKRIYGVDFAKVPTYKPKIFKETQGLVVEDSSWDISVVNEIKKIVNTDRPILVICQTLKDLYLIKEKLEKSQKIVGYKELRTFDSESKSIETKKPVTQRVVVLSTNLAGRGTNLRPDDAVEKVGGLHVCVTFLPCNVRVEEQAFGRTSRQGNSGKANLIVRQSEVEKLNIPSNSSLKDIKAARDRLEERRIETIETELIPDLTFKDEIFGYFSRFCAELKDENKKDLTFKVFIKDLKEWWAFWLEKRNFKGKDLDPKKEFEKFKETRQVKGITNKEISHNPQYCLQLADRYSNQAKPDEAKKCLERALELEPDGIAGAYLKLFEIKIETTSQFLEKCKDAVKTLFGIDTSNSEYKDTIKKYLTQANNLIKKEVKYNEDNLNPESPDFRNILHIHSTNSFLKHLHSRTTCIQVHQKNIESLLKDSSNFDGFDFQSKVETNVQEFGKAVNLGDKAKKYFTNTEAAELHVIGLDTIYSLKEIKGIGADFIKTALAFIAAGIASLVIGLCWLPSFPLMSNIAGTLISEGIVDIVMKIIALNSDKKDFNKGEYVKGKFMKIGKALLSFGLGAIIQCTSILRKAVEFCRKVQKMLSDCLHFKEVVACVKDKLGKIAEFLQLKLDKLEFGRLSNVAKKLKLDELKNIDENLCGQLKHAEGIANQSRKALLTDFIKEVGKATAQRLGVSVTKEFAIKPFIKNAMKDGVNQAIKRLFVEYFTSCTDLKKKLKTANNYKQCSNDYVNRDKKLLDAGRDFGPKAVKFYTDHVDVSDSTLENVSEFARVVQNYANFMKDIAIITTYRKGAKKYLVDYLKDGSSNNNVDAVIDEISTIVGKPVIEIIMMAWDDANAL